MSDLLDLEHKVKNLEIINAMLLKTVEACLKILQSHTTKAIWGELVGVIELAKKEH